MVKVESSGEDPRTTGDLVSNLPHPQVNKTKQHRLHCVCVCGCVCVCVCACVCVCVCVCVL